MSVLAEWRKRRCELYRIDVRYACFGLVVSSGVVRKAAPIAKWAVGKNAAFVLDYFRGKGADVLRIGGIGV